MNKGNNCCDKCLIKIVIPDGFSVPACTNSSCSCHKELASSPDLESSKGWEERFDEKFLIQEGIRSREIDVDIRADVVKREIQQLLDERTREIVEMIPDEIDSENSQYFTSLEELKQAIKEKFNVRD